ncbi:hypothetical protein BRC81_09635 [Halobacteriales archaeon QS_1_68_20]|nr:MAG: hypothetical protein BRC81_09635 [Halobacteriales archaeon QS_1_68_20]
MAADGTGLSGTPVLGHTVPFFHRPLAFRRECAESATGVVRLSVLGRDVFYLSHPDIIEAALVDGHEAFSRDDSLQKRLEPTLGRGLLNSDGEFWKRQRRLVQPAFNPRRIETQYAEVMYEEGRRLRERLEPGETFELYEEMKTLASGALLRTTFGDDVDPEPGYDAIRDINISGWLLPSWVPTYSNRRFRRGLNALNDIVYDEVARRRRERGDGDMLDLLLDAQTDDGTRMTDDEVRDEVVTLLFAGHGTSSAGLTYAMDLLSTHPGIQSSLASGVDRKLDGPPEPSDWDRLDAVDRAYRETLRLYPPTYSIRRRADESTVSGGHEIAEGSFIEVSPWGMQRDRRWYDDPEQFRPDRWTDEYEADLPEFAYSPFGVGPHRCIGRQFGLTSARLTLATPLEGYRYELVSDPDLDLETAVTIEPSTDLEVLVRER